MSRQISEMKLWQSSATEEAKALRLEAKRRDEDVQILASMGKMCRGDGHDAVFFVAVLEERSRKTRGPSLFPSLKPMTYA